MSKIWKDCPRCKGTGFTERNAGPYDYSSHWECRMCEAHFGAVEEAVKREREACASIVTQRAESCHHYQGNTGQQLHGVAAAIRARGTT